MFELDLPWDLHEVCKVPAAEEFSLAEELRMIEMSFRGSNNILSEKIKQHLSKMIANQTTFCQNY